VLDQSITKFFLIAQENVMNTEFKIKKNTNSTSNLMAATQLECPKIYM